MAAASHEGRGEVSGDRLARIEAERGAGMMPPLLGWDSRQTLAAAARSDTQENT